MAMIRTTMSSLVCAGRAPAIASRIWRSKLRGPRMATPGTGDVGAGGMTLGALSRTGGRYSRFSGPSCFMGGRLTGACPGPFAFAAGEAPLQRAPAIAKLGRECGLGGGAVRWRAYLIGALAALGGAAAIVAWQVEPRVAERT